MSLINTKMFGMSILSNKSFKEEIVNLKSVWVSQVATFHD